MSEWLRRQTRNLLGFACAGSNPAVDVSLFISVYIFFLKVGYYRLFKLSKALISLLQLSSLLLPSLSSQSSMAFLLRSNLTFSSPSHSTTTRPISHAKPNLTIRCGPRDNRGPLLKGRTLSIEAIQAVQTLKRAHRTSTNLDDDDAVYRTLSRLIKADLVAAFNELLRQDHIQIAVKVFSTIRSEESYKTDLNIYANLVKALARKRLPEEIDRLILDLETEGGGEIPTESKGLTTLIRAVIAAERGEATARIYGMMKRSGWKCNSGAEDYIARILSTGLKRLGHETVGREIDREYRGMYGDILDKLEAL